MPQTIDNLSVTWANSLTTFTAFKFNAIDNASAAGSLLMDLQVGGSSQFNVTKAGAVTSGSGGLRFSTDTTTAYQFGANNDGSNTRMLYLASASVASLGVYNLGARLRSNGSFGFASGGVDTALDTILTRRAAANLRLGAADAAAPVAQTLSVQSVVAGTTNTAGANLTITGSQGTGTGAGGSIVFQVAPAGSSGTAQNALATALTIDGGGSTLIFGAGGRILTNGGGVYFNTPGNPYYFLDSGGASIANPVSSYAWMGIGSTGVVLRNTMFLGFSSTGDTNVGAGGDVRLYRDTTGILALRNGGTSGTPVPQTFRVYNWTDGTNSEFGSLRWSGNEFIIGTDKTGTGVSRVLKIVKGGVTITINDGGTALAADRAIQAGSGGSQEYGFLVGGVRYESGGTGIASINGGTSSNGAALQLREMTAPAAPAADNVRIYAEDDGAGKTRLMARFATGAAVQIAIEP